MRKKSVALLTALGMLMVLLIGCGASQQVGIEVGEGEFLITPDEFVERWNSALEVMQEKNKDNQDWQHIIPLPPFEESKEQLTMGGGSGLRITYTINDETGNLKEIEYRYYDPAGTQEQALTFGFLNGAMPSFFKPNTKFDMRDELGLNGRGSDSIIAFDGDTIKYRYTVVQGMMHSVTISTKW